MNARGGQILPIPGPSCLSRCHVWRDIVLTIADELRLLLLATSLSLSLDSAKITQSCIECAHTCPLNMPLVIHNAINTIVSLWDFTRLLFTVVCWSINGSIKSNFLSGCLWTLTKSHFSIWPESEHAWQCWYECYQRVPCVWHGHSQSLAIKIVVMSIRSLHCTQHFNYSVLGQAGPSGIAQLRRNLHAEFLLEFVPNISNACSTSRALNLPPVLDKLSYRRRQWDHCAGCSDQSGRVSVIFRPISSRRQRREPITASTYVSAISDAIVNITCRLSNYTADFLPPLDYKFFLARFGEP